MKYNRSQRWAIGLTAITLLMASQTSFALKSDTQQPIHVHSAQQDMDIEHNIVTLTGNVIVQQGSIEIKADKVVITRPNGNKGREVIDGYGDPVTFYQMQDNGKPIRGHAQKIHYQVAEQKLILTSNAYVEQQNNNINAEQITYLVQQQKMQATSNKNKPVTTILVPSQLQNNQAASNAQPSSKKK